MKIMKRTNSYHCLLIISIFTMTNNIKQKRFRLYSSIDTYVMPGYNVSISTHNIVAHTNTFITPIWTKS